MVGQQDWLSPIGSNWINMAMELSSGNKVLYCNPPLSLNTVLRGRAEDREYLERRRAVASGRAAVIEEVQENLFVYNPTLVLPSVNFLPDGALFDLANRFNNRRWAAAVRKALDALGWPDFHLLIDGDMIRSFYLPDLLSPVSSIYYSRDNFSAVDYWKKHGLRLEPLLMKKCQAVTANSVWLRNQAEKHNSRSYFIGQGCDLSQFNPAAKYPEPTDLASIPHPRITYIGALLELRLDPGLLEFLAREQPEHQWVLVGPEDEAFKRSALHTLGNVHFLGSKKGDELASYLAHSDAAINPQILNAMTIGNYPRKIDEYLAMGLPTIATSTEAMNMFLPEVYLAANREEWAAAVKLALAEDSPEKRTSRRTMALGHSWENCIQSLLEVVEEVS